MLEFRTSWTFFRNVLNWCSFNQQTEISCEEKKYLHPKRTIIPPTPMKYFHSVFVSVYKACILFLYLHLHWWARNWIWLVGFSIWHFCFPFLRGYRKHLLGATNTAQSPAQSLFLVHGEEPALSCCCHLYIRVMCRRSSWKHAFLWIILQTERSQCCHCRHEQRQRAQRMQFPPCNT